jgi:probable F420-dependent oxidoreductase
MNLGKVGVWLMGVGFEPAAAERELVAELEELGYGALWIGEFAGGKEPLTHAGLLLAASRTLAVATGIASIWTRDPIAMGSGARTLAEAYPGRFVLGLGVSHHFIVEARGHRYERPLSRMRAYLDAMDAAEYRVPEGPEPFPRVLAALRRPMLELAAERADGAHPYFVPVEHTRRAREILGPGKLLCPEQGVLLETDPAVARARARELIGLYLQTPNYIESLRSLGFGDDDLAHGGSDRLVDALIAWGDEDAIRARVEEHLDAGADHVCIQPIASGWGAIDTTELRRLAPALTDL